MLKMNPNERFDVRECLNHSWIQTKINRAEIPLNFSLDNFKTYLKNQ